jgi:predicted DNA-binding transcriptional regulator AlpA
MQSEIASSYLKKAEVCAHMGISPRTLENLVLKGKFPKGVSIGKWAYWSPKVLQNWHKRQFAVQEAWQLK